VNLQKELPLNYLRNLSIFFHIPRCGLDKKRGSGIGPYVCDDADGLGNPLNMAASLLGRKVFDPRFTLWLVVATVGNTSIGIRGGFTFLLS